MLRRIFIVMPIATWWLITSVTMIIPLVYWIITGNDYFELSFKKMKKLS